MTIPSLTSIAAQRAYSLLVPRPQKNKEKKSLPSPCSPFPTTEPIPLSEKDIAIEKRRAPEDEVGESGREKVQLLRAQLLTSPSSPPPMPEPVALLPEKHPLLPEEILNVLDEAFLTEDLFKKLNTESAWTSPNSIFAEKAKMFLYFLLSANPQKRDHILELFEQVEEKPNRVFDKNVKNILYSLFLNLPPEKILGLWGAAFCLTEKKPEDTEEGKSSALEIVTRKYAGQVLIRILKKNPSLLSLDLVNTLKERYPYRQNITPSQQAFLLQVLSFTSCEEIVKAFAEAFPLLEKDLDPSSRLLILESLSQNESSAVIKAFHSRYPGLFTADSQDINRYQILENLAQNKSAEAIQAFIDAAPHFIDNLDARLRSYIIENLARNTSLEAIQTVLAIVTYPTKGLDVKIRSFIAEDFSAELHATILENLATNTCVEVIQVFAKALRHLSKKLDAGYCFSIAEYLARNTSAEAIQAFAKAFHHLAKDQDTNEYGLYTDPFGNVLGILAQNGSIKAIQAFAQEIHNLSSEWMELKDWDIEDRDEILKCLPYNRSTEAAKAFLALFPQLLENIDEEPSELLKRLTKVSIEESREIEAWLGEIEDDEEYFPS